MKSLFFRVVETNPSSYDVQQVQLHPYLGCDRSNTVERPVDRVGYRSLSALTVTFSGLRSEPKPVVPKAAKTKKKRKRKFDDRRAELRAKVRYACTQLKVFTTKEESHFVCGSCSRKLPNKQTEGLVVTDASSQPACMKCSDFLPPMANLMRNTVEAGFGKPREDHPVAKAMRAKPLHEGQHGPACAACCFLVSCVRAQQWGNAKVLERALEGLDGCPEAFALELVDRADRQARSRVRGRNHAPVDMAKLATAADVNAVRDANIREQIQRVERCAGVLCVEATEALAEAEAEALADAQVEAWTTAHPGGKNVPMFVRVRVQGGAHIGVYTNKMTEDSKDEKIRKNLDVWYKLAQAYGIKV